MRVMSSVKNGLILNFSDFKTSRQFSCLNSFAIAVWLTSRPLSKIAATAVEILSSASEPVGNFKVVPDDANAQVLPSSKLHRNNHG